MIVLTEQLKFPPLHAAEPDGLLAIGGDLSIDRLKLAYQQGIFPWYEGGTILWWSPNPRFVLFPHDLVVSKSMQQVIKAKQFTFTINKAFENVIRQCKMNSRKDQDGTWITDEMEAAYNKLHKNGMAISAEAWENDQLVGGLYGILLNNIFCGESMFTNKSNASKFAFIQLVQYLKEKYIQLIDCQVYTEHLESLGARMISREEYLKYLL
jgi:leucyl/phenylalanyl-tRNA---protein transferase